MTAVQWPPPFLHDHMNADGTEQVPNEIPVQAGDKLAEGDSVAPQGLRARPGRDAEFVPFPKIGRLNRHAIITEKIDGTNAQVHVTEQGEVFAGSRKRWISPGKSTDNYGFAAWVAEHRSELAIGLGPGTHFGEWWGQGIARGYDLDEKRFWLFNTERWSNPAERPACCGVVPVLAEVDSINELAYQVARQLHLMRLHGSTAAPGFLKAEGIVIFHTAKGTLFKVTLEHDELPKEVLEREKTERLAA